MSLDRLIAAECAGAAISAARGLKQVTEPYCREDGPWQVLARASTEALARASFAFTAKLGLAAVFWQAFFRTEMMGSGLPQVSTSALLPILLNSFEACTHLPERTVIGADAQSVFDVEDTRNRCQQALSDLPVADYRRSFTRTRPARPCRGPTSGTDCASRSSSPLSAVIPTYAFPTRSLARWGWWQFASGAWRDTEPGRVTAGTVEVVRFDEADVRGV